MHADVWPIRAFVLLYVDDFPVAKCLRDARVMTLYEGTSQIQKLPIGRAGTGISAFT
jgi:alkylation response protein AidB-like acyl-CoA dehydrogenase